MKFVLILMVRNESRILERCLKSVEKFVDAFCIHDTGSTDNTCEIAKTFLENGPHKGCLTESKWENFGTNRTTSFVAAQHYLKAAEWDLSTTYGLLMDGDMIFHSENLKDYPLKEIGYSVIQSAGHLEYPNCRLVRMDYHWKCVGVTHEYWDGVTTALPKSVCWIEDCNDGGCKSDKFERDARLLEKGLEENPKNERYMFYLAQTYHSLGRWKDSIAMYKKRFGAGGWVEEQWYSLYMIGDCYLKLNDSLKFELYMQKAMEFRPSRAEAAYALTKHFREKGQHYKAWYYLLRGRGIPYSTDSLFIVKPVYTDYFAYEATILLYYLDKQEEGLRESMKYLLTKTEHLDNVYRNMAFYVKPLGTEVFNHTIDRGVAGLDFHPSSVSFFGDLQNVRFVNYVIDQTNGSYTMKEGSYSPNHKVRTRNVLLDGETATLIEEQITLPKQDSHIQGLEDVRIYQDGKGDMRFVATSCEYSPKIRMIGGVYDREKVQIRDCTVLHPPTDTQCEKNWLPISGTNNIIYKWNPLEIGTIDSTNTLVVQTTHPTPWLFKHLRGSAIPFEVENELWTLVHYVEYCQPRKYFHCFVTLDKTTYKPIAISLPFVFDSQGIEYCLGCKKSGNHIIFAFSTWDDNPRVTAVSQSKFEWIQL